MSRPNRLASVGVQLSKWLVPRQLMLAAAAGLLLGAAEAARAWHSSRLAVGPRLFEGTTIIGLLASVAVVVGLLQLPVVAVFREIARRGGLYGWLRQRTTRDRNAEREPVIRFHAVLSSIVLVSALLLLALERTLRVLERATEPAFQRALTLAAVVSLAALGVLLTLAVAMGLSRVFRAIDRRLPLPLPSQPWLRYLLFVLLPVAALTVAIARRHGEQLQLAGLQLLVWWPLLIFLQGAVALVWHAESRASRWLPWLLVPLWATAALSCPWLLARSAGADALRGRSSLAHQSMLLLRSISDVDGDGFSSLYRGGDCAAFDSEVHPLAADVADNGVDEDCDGSDSRQEEATAAGATRFSDLDKSKLESGRYNIVWLVVDALRGDRCSVLGYSKKTTPYMEQLAREALLFTNATTQGSITAISVGSMLTGLNARSITWKPRYGGRLQVGEEHFFLPEHLRDNGYRTGLVTGGYMRSKLRGLLRGFEDVQNTWLDGRRMPWYRRNAAIAVGQAVSFIDATRRAQPDTPFFLLIYSADPHDPYDDHPEGFPDFGDGPEARFEKEIAFSDRYMGFLLDFLRYKRKLWKRTIFIVTGDHGEAFGEHGAVRHGYNCHRENVHVPLLIRIPGLKRGKRIDTPVALVDVLPTLLDLLGDEANGVPLDGQSLLYPAFARDKVPADRPIFCSAVPEAKYFRESVRAGDRTLIHASDSGTYALYAAGDREEKRDLSGNPAEAENLRRLKALLRNSLKGNIAAVGTRR